MTKHISLFRRPQSDRSASRSTMLFFDGVGVQLPEGDRQRAANSAVVAAALSAAHARMRSLVGAH